MASVNSCIFCHRDIEVDKYNLVQDAVVFRAWGDYGSRAFGHQDGSFLEARICDGCLLSHKDSFTYYPPRTIRRPEKWNPDGRKTEPGHR